MRSAGLTSDGLLTASLTELSSFVPIRISSDLSDDLHPITLGHGNDLASDAEVKPSLSFQ